MIVQKAAASSEAQPGLSSDTAPTSFDISVENPHGGGEVMHRNPEAIIMEEMAALDAE